MKLLAKLVTFLLLLVFLTACGGTDDQGDDQGSKGGDVSPATSTERAYFNGLSHNTLDSLGQALDAAASGSAAAAYATYVRGVAQAAKDAGSPYAEGEDMTRVAGGFRHCLDDDDADTCLTYADIREADGKVSGFTMNGDPVESRVVADHSEAVTATHGGSSAQFVAAYRSTQDSVFVVVRLKAGEKGVTQVQARYRSGDGAGVTSNNQAGPSELAAGKQASYLFVFPKSDLGGTLTLTIADSAFADSRVVLRTPTRE